MLEGLIIRGVGGFYYVETESGVYQCRARGLFKKQGITPMVGDRVAIDLTEEEEVEGYVTEIHPRRNSFIRPPIANVDLLLVTAAFRHPAPNLRLIDRFLVMAQMAGTEAVICFNKADLANEEQIEDMQRIYGSSYEVRFLSAKNGDGIAALAERVAGLQVALAGDAYYFGKLKRKPVIGDPVREITPDDIRRANCMMTVTSGLAMAAGMLLRVSVLYLLLR